jgi:hypothetical protein
MNKMATKAHRWLGFDREPERIMLLPRWIEDLSWKVLFAATVVIALSINLINHFVL